jgi:hypothetical protein
MKMPQTTNRKKAESLGLYIPAPGSQATKTGGAGAAAAGGDASSFQLHTNFRLGVLAREEHVVLKVNLLGDRE